MRKDNLVSWSILISIIVGVALIQCISLASASLGTFKQGSCVQLKGLSNGTAMNISTISLPNSTVIESNKVMTKVGSTFIYEFCNTNSLGTYIYDYYEQNGNLWVNDFVITTTGQNNGNTIPLFLLLGGFILMVMAIVAKNEYFGFFAGTIFIVTYVYMMIYGLGLFTDMYTRTISYISLGLGIILCVASVYEYIWAEDEDETED